MRSTLMMSFLEVAFNGHSVVGAEVGVFQGGHALVILKKLNIDRLYLIDSYDPSDPDFQAKCKPILGEARQIAESCLSLHMDKLIWLFMKSDAAACQIQEPLDFVYIDGNHSYDYVTRDIRNYSALVKPGGYIGGHDYLMNNNPLVEVKKAVDHFIARSGLVLNVSPGRWPEWWVQKE